MKVYSPPAHIQQPSTERWISEGFNWQREEKKYLDAISEYLRTIGYNGKLTGKIVQFSVADGAAVYVIGQKGKSLILVHSEFADGYNYPYVHRLTATDIRKQIEMDQKSDIGFIFDK